MARYVAKVFAVLVCAEMCVAKPLLSSELTSKVEKAKSIAENLNKALGSVHSNIGQVLETINSKARSLADNLGQIKRSIHQEVGAHDGDTKHSLKRLEDSLADTILELGKFAEPEGTAEQRLTHTRSGLKSVLGGVDRIAQSAGDGAAKDVAGKLQKFAKVILDSIVAAGRELQAKVRALVENRPKARRAQH